MSAPDYCGGEHWGKLPASEVRAVFDALQDARRPETLYRVYFALVSMREQSPDGLARATASNRGLSVVARLPVSTIRAAVERLQGFGLLAVKREVGSHSVGGGRNVYRFPLLESARAGGECRGRGSSDSSNRPPSCPECSSPVLADAGGLPLCPRCGWNPKQ